jgi:bacillolysin
VYNATSALISRLRRVQSRWWIVTAAAVAVAGSVTAFAITGDGQAPPAGPFVVSGRAATPSTDPVRATGAATPAPSPSDVAAATAALVQAAAAVAPLSADDAISQLRATAAALDIDRDAHVRMVSAPPGSALPAPEGTPASADAVTVAAAFVNRYGEGFGLRAGQHVVVSLVDSVPGDHRVIRFQQQINGVPVMGGDLAVEVDQAGAIVTAAAETPVDEPVTTASQVLLSAATATATAATVERTGIDAAALRVKRSGLWFYDPSVLGVPGRAGLRLTWWLTVGRADQATGVEAVFIDATDGTLSFAYELQETARNRIICDLGNAGVDLDDPAAYRCSDAPGGPPVVRREIGAPSPVSDVEAAYAYLGETYDFYSGLGRDSIDGHGMAMAATVRACHFSCPFDNAFWDGDQMVFGPGFATADDVVGHELTHGVTQHTSNLFYFAESGGLNEGLSDVMGEFIDQLNGADNDSQWLMGENVPGGAIRSLKDPTLFGDPDRVGTAPWNAALGSSADNYGVHSLSGVVNKTGYLLAAGGTFNGRSVRGIGMPKSAAIWYKLQYLLPSGAEMADVASLLPAACRSVIGLRAITADDCVQAAEATLATGLSQPTGSFDDALDCPSVGMPARTIFSDNFENGPQKWTLGPAWTVIPSTSTPVSFANSGQSALYAFDPAGVGGGISSQAITLPADVNGQNLYLSSAEAVFPGVVGGLVQVYSPVRGTVGGVGISTNTKGYTKRTLSLASLVLQPGDQIWVRPNLRASLGVNEWLLDDIGVYECLPTVTGAPQYVAAQSSGATSVQLTWGAPRYVAPGNPVASYEIGLLPAPPGSTGPITVSGSQLSTTLTGLEAGVRYQVSIQAVGADGVAGPGVLTYIPSDGLLACSILSTDGGRSRRVCTPAP